MLPLEPVDVDAFFPATAWGVSVRRGEVPEHLPSATRVEERFEADRASVLYFMDSSGRMLISRDEVVLDIPPGLDLGHIDFYLYGVVPRVVRILREEYSLHASAVLTPDGAVAVMGSSMAGKSTTVMGLVRRGHRLIVDDVLPVDVTSNAVMVHGWSRPLHLRQQSAEHFAEQGGRRHPLFPEKARAELDSVQELVPLRAIVDLVADEEATEVTCQPLTGSHRLAVVIQHSDVARLAAADGRQPSFFRWAAEVSNRVPVARLTRPTGNWTLDEVLDAVERTARATP